MLHELTRLTLSAGLWVSQTPRSRPQVSTGPETPRPHDCPRPGSSARRHVSCWSGSVAASGGRKRLHRSHRQHRRTEGGPQGSQLTAGRPRRTGANGRTGCPVLVCRVCFADAGDRGCGLSSCAAAAAYSLGCRTPQAAKPQVALSNGCRAPSGRDPTACGAGCMASRSRPYGAHYVIVRFPGACPPPAGRPAPQATSLSALRAADKPAAHRRKNRLLRT